MSINPPSDIVLGAVLAADPAKYRVAAERLKRAAGDTASPNTDFAATMSELPSWRTSTVPETISGNVQSQPARPSPTASAPMARPGGAGKPPDAFAQLEAFVLQSFIQTMLPQNSQGFFGKGTAGEVWKSMLAEKLGAQIASSGQVGLAKRLAVGRVPSAVGALPAMLGGGPRMSSSLTSILPYIKSSTSVREALAIESTSTTERS